jgi:[acyl-carrier-protein] S-malonyltransferase
VYDIYQSELASAIRVAAKYPSSSEYKAVRLEAIENFIMDGADPLKVMTLQGEEVTPLQRAKEYGDPQVLKCIKDAMEKRALREPIIVYADPDLKERFSKAKVVILPVALLFPGQGSQYVKMLAGVKDLPPVKEMLEKATEILGWDPLDLCLNGPEEKLEETKFCQPCMHLANLAALEKLRMEKPEVVNQCKAVAGLSLGEYTACVAAGMMTFEDSLKIVRARAEAMNDAATKSEQAMLSVAGLEYEVLEKCCKTAQEKCGKDAVCKIANHLFPKGYSCSGTKMAINVLKQEAEKAGAMQARPLKTAGAFHTECMAPAAPAINRILGSSYPNMSFPRCHIYMNSTGKIMPAGTDPREINMELVKQVQTPVLWQNCIEGMIADGIEEFYECGPMKQLKAMMKRTNQEMWEKTYNVDV